MRVAIDGRTIQDHFPGIGRYVFQLVEALSRLTDGHLFYLLHDPGHTDSRFRVQELAEASPAVRLVPVRLSPFDWRSQFIVPRLLRALRVDVFHATYYLMPYFSFLPTIVTLYDAIPFLFPHYLPAGLRLFARLGMRLAAQRADRVIAISHSAAEDLMSRLRIGSAKMQVISLAAGVHFRPMRHAVSYIGAWRQRQGLPEHFVLYVGTNKPHKNLERLAYAWKLVIEGWGKDEGSRPALVLAGHWDPRYPEVKEAVTALGLERWVQWREDVPECDLPLLYNAAELFVFPSLYEGFGLPVLEAMACGIPVACSRIPALLEVGGDAVMGFDPSREEDMAAHITKVLKDVAVAGELRRRGELRSRRFSWESAAEQTLKVYGECVSRAD